MKRVYCYGDFLPFERQQFEDYLNALVKKGYHVKIKSGDLYVEDDSNDVTYQVVIAPKKSDEKDIRKFIDFFEESGFCYIGQYGCFCVFESETSQLMYTDDIVEEDVIISIAKKDLRKAIYAIILFVVGMYAYIKWFSFKSVMSNSNVFGTFYLALFVIVFSIIHIHYYRLYFKHEKRDYNYQICFFRGFVVNYLIILALSDGFVFGTQSMMLDLMVTILFFVIGLVAYYRTRYSNHVFPYEKLNTIAFLIGILSMFTPVNIPVPQSLKQYDMTEKERSVLLEYAVLENETESIEYVNIKHDMTTQFILDMFIGKEKVISSKNIDGYIVESTEKYNYIIKDKKIIKINAASDVSELIERLNW